MVGDLFEIALVVDDIERAVAAELRDVHCTEPLTSAMELWTPEGSFGIELTIAYTRRGPLRLEVIEAAPGSIFWEEAGMHHFGFFSDDLAADAQELEQRGMPLVATRAGGDGRYWQFTYHSCPPFGLIELVDTMMQPFLQHWWEDGTAARELYPKELTA